MVAPRLEHIHNLSVPKKIKWIKEFVDRIYDDFESRTCENCTYLYRPDLTNGIYRCENNVVTIEDGEIELDFGCNKFSCKEDKQYAYSEMGEYIARFKPTFRAMYKLFKT